jgi:hypothetical protein
MSLKNILAAVIIIAAVLLLLKRCSSGTKENMIPITQQVTEKRGFLPSHQGPWFQNLPPSTKMENDYHTYIHNDCNGDYANLECRQKAYIKAVKAGTTDLKDLLCWRMHPDQGGTEDLYYKCLDGVYGNYIWMDRFTGASPCLCNNGEFPGQGQGAGAADGSCYCPKHRPLAQRWALDENGQVVDRITTGNYN